MKNKPKSKVNTKETTLILYSPSSIEWWHQVTETPEETNKIVFKNGTPLGSKGATPKEGQTPPTSTAGSSAK